jgi:hypothetical protein
MYGSKSFLALCSVSLLLLASCSHNSSVPTRVAGIPSAVQAPAGGNAAGNHVKLFRDQLPWHSYAQDSVLISLGFTRGPGPDQYEIIGSSAMAATSLVPGQDLVIVSGDQDQTFYNNYANHMTRFDSFVQSGGSLFLEACDEAWNLGVMDSALDLPGGVHANFALDTLNYILNPRLLLLAGIPQTMNHEFASHEWFSDLPQTASDTVYCVDSKLRPTLAVYGLGTGRVLISGQPLEHQYDHIYGSPDMEQLLPRLLAYFTGKPLPATPSNALMARVRSMQLQSAGAHPASSARAARR